MSKFLFQCIDFDKRSDFTSYEVSLKGFKNGKNNIKDIKITHHVQTVWQKIFWGDDQSYNVQNISSRAFANNKIIESADLHFIGSISYGAFINCSNLKILVVRCIYIDDNVFENCINLRKATINVIFIGNSAFKNCNIISNISLKTDIQYIGESAFEGCSCIESFDISESCLTAISRRTFANCTNLKEITLPTTVNSIASEAFLNCISMEKVIVKGEVYKIDPSAFSNCKNLKSIIFQDNVNIISKFAFQGCENLVEVKFEQRLFTVEEHAFMECIKLKKIEINVDKQWADHHFKVHNSVDIDFIPLGFKSMARGIKNSYIADAIFDAQQELEDALYYAHQELYGNWDDFDY